MIKNIDNNYILNNNIEKILVCITAQSNALKLIDKATKIADNNNAELHIIHVLKGDNIFNNNETLKMLNEIFDYGKEKGGMIHAFCNDDVCSSIINFVKNYNITKVVLGENLYNNKLKILNENFFDSIIKKLPKNVDTIIIKKNDNNI